MHVSTSLFECGYYTEFQPRHMYGSSNKIQPWKTPEHMRLKRVDLKGRGPRRQLGPLLLPRSTPGSR